MAKISTTISANKERAPLVYDRLAELYPDIRCTLEYRSPFHLLIMTALAAQCTDARVNIVCKDLFPQASPRPRPFTRPT